jgi:hypothetical protein
MTIYKFIDGEIVELTPEEEIIHNETVLQNQAVILGRLVADIREKRNSLLKDSDWIELPSAVARLTTEQRSFWETYRQALRDLPSQTNFPEQITWPEIPV